MLKKKGKSAASPSTKNGRSAGPSSTKGKQYKNSELIQTLVPKDVSQRIKELSREEGMSLAAYVRRLILIDWRKKTSAGKRTAA